MGGAWRASICAVWRAGRPSSPVSGSRLGEVCDAVGAGGCQARRREAATGARGGRWGRGTGGRRRRGAGRRWAHKRAYCTPDAEGRFRRANARLEEGRGAGGATRRAPARGGRGMCSRGCRHTSFLPLITPLLPGQHVAHRVELRPVPARGADVSVELWPRTPSIARARWSSFDGLRWREHNFGERASEHLATVLPGSAVSEF